MALDIIITNAGRAAIVNAQNTGTLPIVLNQVALGTGRWAPDATATELDTELKRINAVGGSVVADDTIHVTMTDESADAYALGEFGLYTSGGVLFAIYSDLGGITEKAADAALLLAFDCVLASVPAGSVTVGGTGFNNPPASEVQAGVAELATQEEASAGEDDTRIVTSKKAKTAAGAYLYVVNQALDNPADAGNLAQLLSWMAGRIVGITGKADWKTPPAATLEALSGARFPSGTVMLFQQSASPVGWTKVIDHNDKALRVVSGAVGAGGSVAFSGAFANRTVSSTTASGSVGNTTLTSADIPAHYHIEGMGTYNSGDATHGRYGTVNTGSSEIVHTQNGTSTYGAKTSSYGGSTAHNHPFTAAAHDHDLDMRVAYVDVIFARKN